MQRWIHLLFGNEIANTQPLVPLIPVFLQFRVVTKTALVPNKALGCGHWVKPEVSVCFLSSYRREEPYSVSCYCATWVTVDKRPVNFERGPHRPSEGADRASRRLNRRRWTEIGYHHHHRGAALRRHPQAEPAVREGASPSKRFDFFLFPYFTISSNSIIV